MEFAQPLIRAALARRYKRFLSDHQLEDGRIVTAHCANPGAMLGLTEPGSETWLSIADSPKRKLRYTWELVRVAPGETGLVGINASRPNALAAEAIAAQHIPELAGYTTIRREVRYGENSRIDLLLEGPGREACYVEVKNVHLRRGAGPAEFPDSVTARGAKHLRELARTAQAGRRALMLYLVQRADCSEFRLATDIDPAYGEAFHAARRQGVETLCYACMLSPRAITVARPLSVSV